MDKETGEYLDDEIEHIKQSVADILLTAKGTRIMRRTYGSNLYKLIDRPISAGLALQISCACVMALKQWEPRIEVNSFKVAFSSLDAPYSLTGSLEATIKATNTIFKMENVKIK
ncbi:baseplate wedge subunit [Pasteurellaceae bacterium LFhippo2]|nr:baseplate wedge subunit [Pasteurellaceae bacterium LFhippo2]